MNMKKLAAVALAGLMTLGAMDMTQAATREEIAAIHVSKSGEFNYWTQKSAAKEKLVSYVKDITNKHSKNFIPVEDRIAVFDMDGTFLCETAPYYFDGMLYLDRALNDKNYQASESDREFAKELKQAIQVKKAGALLEKSAPHQASVFAGMNYSDYTAYVEKFMKTPVEGLAPLKWGEAFYLPMVEVIKYLQENKFQVYVVSGTERQLVRILVCDLLKIPTNNIIGTDIKIHAAHQGDTPGLDYSYGKDDYLVRGQFVIKCLKMNKTEAIAREIGKQPVLAFGNSSGDTSMLNYTINGNKYKSAAFFLLCDDLERELGNTEKAEKSRKLADENGWTSISMRDDFKTIYGDKVKRTN